MTILDFGEIDNTQSSLRITAEEMLYDIDRGCEPDPSDVQDVLEMVLKYLGDE